MRIYKILSAVCVVFILTAFVLASVNKIGLALDFGTLLFYRERIWRGFVMTLGISAASLGVSLVIGAATAAAQRVRFLPLRYLCRAYVQIIRGTPLLVQIYFFYYITGTAWGIHNRYLAGVLILSVFEGAYISEIIRGGLDSIDPLNYEIARSIGLTRLKTLRLVTLPMLLARILPSLAGQFASIIKDSSLLSVIAVIELTQTTQEISAENFRMFENYIAAGVMYFALTFAVSLLSGALERRMKVEYKN